MLSIKRSMLILAAFPFPSSMFPSLVPVGSSIAAEQSAKRRTGLYSQASLHEYISEIHERAPSQGGRKLVELPLQLRMHENPQPYPFKWLSVGGSTVYKGKWLRNGAVGGEWKSLSRRIFLTFSYLCTLFLLQAVCSGHPHDYSTWKTWTKHAESQLSSGRGSLLGESQ